MSLITLIGKQYDGELEVCIDPARVSCVKIANPKYLMNEAGWCTYVILDKDHRELVGQYTTRPKALAQMKRVVKQINKELKP